MQTVLIIAAVTASNAICFLLGARRSLPEGFSHQRPDAGIKKILPFGHKKEPTGTDPMDVIMENLETYDGTSFGQKEIPKG